MQFKKLTLYTRYDFHTPDITKRSILYCLEPIGVGTPKCESLISYLIRLAENHCVTPDKLIKHKIYPIFWGHDDLCTYYKGIIGRTFINHSHIKSLNFSGWYTSKLVESLELLTLREDLTFLTMMHWHELINHIYLFRYYKAWCPLCYDYWRQNKLPIYEPLLWCFEPVIMCEHHHYPLATQCPHCNQQLAMITATSRQGYCNHCGQWLVDKEKLSLSSLSAFETALQVDLIKIWSSLIAFTPEAYNDTKKAFYKQIIAYFQLKELADIELSNRQISPKRIYKSMTYTGRTVQDFWKALSPTAFNTALIY
ncbi:TniQ family protein [Nostoc sp.]|uniref:TniQ family protein n=1 Tax=Nostoc sp. TaxID=1180 RepID=UPI0035949451